MAEVRRLRPEGADCAACAASGGHGHDPGSPARSWLPSLLAAAGLFAAGIAAGHGPWADVPAVARLGTVLLVAAWLLAGRRVLWRGVRDPLRGRLLDENFLMTVATTGALVLGQPAEAAGVMVFFMAGEALQQRAVDRSRRSVRALLVLKSEVAHRLAGETTEDVDPAALVPGDRIRVRPGERIPVDGTVIAGEAAVDLSALTGESLPRRLAPGDAALSGTLCRDGLLTLRVERPLAESTVARILALVEDATARKARAERFITRFARVYTPVVVALAVAVAVLPPLAWGEPWSRWIHRALVLLVISCPCALVLSIPLGYFAGLGRAAARGVLVKGSTFLDGLARPAAVAFDKTGTLTRGELRVARVHTRNGTDPATLLELAALAEAHSSHPAAAAIRAALDRPVNPAAVTAVEEVPGAGVVARTDRGEIVAGSHRLMHEREIDHDTCGVTGTVVHVARDGRYAGYLVLADTLKDDAAAAVRELKRLGVPRVVMVTGDDAGVAAAVGEAVGVDAVHAELLPADKVAVVEELIRAAGGRGSVVFVGDGINDAPVLARADVGVAMGALGSDAAVETADVVLMDDHPSRLAEAVALARATGRIVRQNIALALGIKGVVLVLGAAGLATMWEAVFADVGVTLLAVANALRLLRWRAPAAVH